MLIGCPPSTFLSFQEASIFCIFYTTIDFINPTCTSCINACTHLLLWINSASLSIYEPTDSPILFHTSNLKTSPTVLSFLLVFSMDTLYATAMNNYINSYNHHSVQPSFDRTHVNCHDFDPTPMSDQDPSPSVVAEGDGSDNQDHYDSVLKFLNQMLMEEDDLQEKPCMYNECLALQVEAAEKSLYDVLVNNHPASSQEQNLFPACQKIPLDYSAGPTSSEGSSNNFSTVSLIDNGGYHNLNSSRKRSPSGEELRDAKLAMISEVDSDQPEPYEEDLLLYDHEPQWFSSSELGKKMNESSKRGRPRGKKNTITQEIVVDLRDLLTQCAQAITNNNPTSVCDVLKKIQPHCTPYGDSTERLAHYFVKAIEARLAGNGAEIYRAYKLKKISAAQILRAHHSYMMACPFHRMSNILANGSIEKLSRGKQKLHIIDFGILYGFQWPCFIKNLSMRPGGPPMLQITGIDLPQPGFRPAERVEETGNRLAKYCKRFNVPFKYNGIAMKWDEIRIEDLKIDKNELTVVNSINRLRNIHDETVVESSPRDSVLQLIRQINPDMFVLGILNGTHNAPFLLNRFREALFHFSTLFDMFDNTTDRQSEHRFLYEQEVFGREVMNVVACEGTTRVERPETYKQWQSRNVRAGFRQVPMLRDKVEEVTSKVRMNYHKDFLVDEDGKWMLQGWKGRVLYACSLWKPA
ncbi:scarecrow-like protein 30 [Cynara cardunculus var. scolymus]|nr:scarecrow-like protein 30 [Cynara cardunculus var. scolymus]